ncbi:MAG: alkaline phosphatase, partial [Comamonadaceae bacterium]
RRAAQQPRNPVFIGGDIHQNWVANVHARPYDIASPVVGSEFCGTSITSGTSTSPQRAAQLAGENPHCLLNNVEKRGYGMVDVQPRRTTVRLRVLDDVADPASGAQTLAAFAVEDGRPGIGR